MKPMYHTPTVSVTAPDAGDLLCYSYEASGFGDEIDFGFDPDPSDHT